MGRILIRWFCVWSIVKMWISCNYPEGFGSNLSLVLPILLISAIIS